MDEKLIDKYLQQLQDQVQKTINDADPFRVQSYAQLERVQLTKQQVLTKQKQRLSSKLGTEHPRVKKTDAQIMMRTQAIRGVQAELRRAATEQPSIDPNDWIVHGNVKDKTGKALAGVHVLLADKSGKLIKALGEAATDRKGYFRLIVDNIAMVLKKLGADDFAKKIYVYPQVMDNKNVVLHRSERALQPNPGQTDFVELVVGKGGGEINRPPIKPISPAGPGRIVPPAKTKPTPATDISIKETLKPQSLDVKKKTIKKK